ncbi:cobalamin-binding protein [Edaphobacillus lindanitolerans]|uniref:Iron complex transport system substrate-binding protein n=1 Tax=Edaphobacillus lindanitolerans TaxID=550447 RepID=A0A1U7PNP0_9BACI|nr:cobalamin-binding protein [Edaphobacillus lindanitolerans]SIT85302.1 iron complex transport system substrate-binding protein [Edaphobacillus lindanitolerans]
MKLVSICPSNTELAAYLGIAGQLAGVDDFSDWPGTVRDLPRLGPDLSIDMDRLESLEPDLVLASLSVPGMERNVEELRKRSIPHLVLDPQSLGDIEDDLIRVGEACGIEAEARRVSAEYRRFLEEMKERSERVTDTPTLYWEWWPKPVFTPGSVNWLTEVSRIAGGRNLYEDVELASIQTDWEDVRLRNPDRILLAWVGVRTEKIRPELLQKRPGWPELAAMQDGKVDIMEESLYCRPSPRLLEGAWKLGRLLHPEVYGDLELPEWVNREA